MQEPVVVTVYDREEAMIRRGPTPPWIEVYQNGELASEWQETKDVELWRWLDSEPPRGRGRSLQQARR